MLIVPGERGNHSIYQYRLQTPAKLLSPNIERSRLARLTFFAGCLEERRSESRFNTEDLAVPAPQPLAEPHLRADCARAARSPHLIHGCVSALLHVRESFTVQA